MQLLCNFISFRTSLCSKEYASNNKTTSSTHQPPVMLLFLSAPEVERELLLLLLCAPPATPVSVVCAALLEISGFSDFSLFEGISELMLVIMFSSPLTFRIVIDKRDLQVCCPVCSHPDQLYRAACSFLVSDPRSKIQRYSVSNHRKKTIICNQIISGVCVKASSCPLTSSLFRIDGCRNACRPCCRKL